MKTDPLNFLNKQSQLNTLKGPVWTGAAGLALTLAAVLCLRAFVPDASNALPWVWLAGVVISLGIAAILCRGKNLFTTARTLDQQYSTKNRLETVAELKTSQSPLAAAQRAETAASLEQISKPRFNFTYPGIALLVLLILAHLSGFGIFLYQTATAAPVVETPETPAELPVASLRWKTPQSETKATNIEEVPLTAEAESSTGLVNMSLEVAVNGEHRLSIPHDKVEKGVHTMDTSVYLDELAVEPFDMITYHMQAQRIHPDEVALTKSPLQFIQVRPLREDTLKMAGMGGADGDPCLQLILKLKIAQLQLMKQNFVLASNEIPKTSELWITENDRVGTEQQQLGEKMDEVFEFLINNEAPTQVIDLLKQAEPQMLLAAKEIYETQNTKATPPQGRALGFITECEKIFVKVIVESSAQAKPSEKVADPFKDEQQFEMPTRESTPAGQLEQLAEKQEELLNSISEAAGSSSEQTDTKEQTEKQEEIADAIAKLTEESNFPETVKDVLKKAQENAKKSTEQLAEGDSVAAIEPATQTLAGLQSAASEMTKAGEQSAAAALANAQEELNDAADLLNEEGDDAAGKAADQVDSTQDDLLASAKEQQESGSEEAARELAKLAKAIAESKIGEALAKQAQGESDGEGAGNQETLEKLAGMAAASAAQMEGGEESLAGAIDALQRGKANLERLAKNPSADSGTDALAKESLAQIRTALQRVAPLLTKPETKTEMEQVFNEILEYRTRTNTVVALGAVVEPLDSLIQHLSLLMRKNVRDEMLAEFDNDAVPPAYRDAVAVYFERLSRDFETPAVAPASNP